MVLLRRLLRILFYLSVGAIILSRAVTSGINHDENQFIAPGQLLAERGLLPYRDYPYTHMPYAIPFYALAASVSQFDYLAARLLGVLTWAACIVVLLVILRLVARRMARRPQHDDGWAALLGEFALIAIFVNHPLSAFLQGSALNHMLATLFSLLAFLFFMRGSSGATGLRTAAFWSGMFVCAAGLVRLNYASLIPILLLLWLLYASLFMRSRLLEAAGAFAGGVAIAALPALALAATAPAHFYYGNIVYIQLNTLYYRGIDWHEAMNLLSKADVFMHGTANDPAGIVLYAGAANDPASIVLYAGSVAAAAWLVLRLVRRGPSVVELNAAGAAAFAGTLFLTGFSPTPSQLQYFFAPIPFLLVLIGLYAWPLRMRAPVVYFVAAVLMMGVTANSIAGSDTVQDLQRLSRPATWPPLEVHAFAESLSSQQHVPSGPVLAILPMIPSEAGYSSYPFTATGPFSWRTSLLLSAARRAQYGVTSPEELTRLLDSDPPVAILTGLEPPKAGFNFRDPGGLERPFAQYAAAHGYSAVTLYAEFLQRSVTLWVRGPQATFGS